MANNTEGQIDELYQLPLDEFTAARNAAAKDTGDASLKKLEKPNLAAWAVNQLYWQQRKIYDEVIKTSGQVRTAYKQMLAGKAADVKAAEVFHTEAMRKAKDAIRKLLEAAGNTCLRCGDDACHRNAGCAADHRHARAIDEAASSNRI